MCLKFEEGVHFKLEQIHSVPIVDEHFAEVKKDVKNVCRLYIVERAFFKANEDVEGIQGVPIVEAKDE